MRVTYQPKPETLSARRVRAGTGMHVTYYLSDKTRTDAPIVSRLARSQAHPTPAPAQPRTLNPNP